MTNSDERPAEGRPPDGPWWFCVRHMRAEPADTPCPGKDLLGPYQTRDEAVHALDKVRERNEAWDAQD